MKNPASEMAKMRWSKTTKAERSAEMSRVAKEGWKKRKKLTKRAHVLA